MADMITFGKRKTQGLLAAQAEKKDQYLAFTLGGETFAMAIRSIKEVIQFSTLTRVPLMPPFMLGVINLRGMVVPVLDIAVRFKRPSTRAGHRTCIVILEVSQEEGAPAVLGVMVDSVSEVLEIGPSQIEPAPAFGSDLRTDFIAGVAKVNGNFVLLLEVSRVLCVDELAALAAPERDGVLP